MKAVKNINNNVSICLDSKGNECIVMGKGIGFIKAPSDIPLDKIERTFYSVDPVYLDYLRNMNTEIMDASIEIIDTANKMYPNQYSNNLVFALSDHIEFVIKRYKEGMFIELPFYYEIKRQFKKEMEIGIRAVEIIDRRFDIKLPKDEAASIAMHFLKGDEKVKRSSIDDVSDIVEEMMNVKVDKNGFNYARFVTHLYYLMDRAKKNELSNTVNNEMFNSLKDKYRKTYECSIKIAEKLNLVLNDEELMYLIIHINRLCVREEN